MWHRKQDIVRRLYDLGMSPRQIDEYLNPGSPGNAARMLRSLKAKDDRRDLTVAGAAKAEYILRALTILDATMRHLDVDAPAPSRKDTRARRRGGAYHYHGNQSIEKEN